VQDFRGLAPQQWHQRYLVQAGWTQHIRQYFLEKIHPVPGLRILEIGSGTGAILQAISKVRTYNIFGVDIDRPSLAYSNSQYPTFKLVQGNGQALPYSQNTFDLTFCHYLLMWVENPRQILYEMYRVTAPGGWVLALAEPDHVARLDYPPPLDQLGKQQTQSLLEQGVDIRMGRKLRSLFYQTRLTDIEVGIMSAEWNQQASSAIDETEWVMAQADLNDRLTDVELRDFQQADQLARHSGARILFIPTFYAFGRVT